MRVVVPQMLAVRVGCVAQHSCYNCQQLSVDQCVTIHLKCQTASFVGLALSVPVPHVVRSCIQVFRAVNDFRFMWVSFCSKVGVGYVEFLQVRRHQGRVTQSVTIIHAPQVHQASIFLQRLPWVTGSCDFSGPLNWK